MPHDYYSHQTSTTYNNNDIELLDSPNAVSLGRSLGWIGDSWHIFMAYPLLWIGIGLVYIIAYLGASSIFPIIGFFLGMWTHSLLLAGIANVAYKIENREEVQFADVFFAFSQKAGDLAKLALMQFGIAIAVIIVFLILTLMGVAYDSQQQNSILMLIIILGVASAFITISITFLSPLLVVFHDVPAFQSMKLSLSACFCNLIPLLIFSIVTSLLGLLSLIPLGLGLFVIIPILHIATYIIYKETLTSE